MTDLPWLIPADGPEPARRRAERTERAARDLAAVHERVGGPLVLHEAVDISFAFDSSHLPPGTVDRRAGDALEAALADPAAVVVTGAGICIGTPIEADPRWAELERLDRHRVLLVTSALSGAYFGCLLRGPRGGRFLDGVAEQVVGMAARLVYPNGDVLDVVRTTLGYSASGIGSDLQAPSLAAAIAHVPGIPESVTSELLTTDELARVLAEAERLPPASLTLNGQRWSPV